MTYNLGTTLMQRLFTACAVLVALMAVSAEARADFRNGNKLYADCTGPNYFDLGLCYGYIAAIADAARRDQDGSGGVLGYQECGRNQVTIKQIVDVSVRFLAAHPERRDIAAAQVVAQALSEAFPCR